MKRSSFALGLILFALPALTAQNGPGLSIDEIMRGPDFVGVPPSQVRWAGDNRTLYFHWRKPGEKEEGTYRVQIDGSHLERLSEEEEARAWPLGGLWDRAHRRRLFVREGDLFLYHAEGRLERLLETREPESNPHFTSDETHVFFTRGDNLFLLSLAKGEIRQLTDFRHGTPPHEKKLTESQKFLLAQQEELFQQFSGEKKAKYEKEEKKRKAKEARAFYIKKGERVSSLLLSPDQRYVLFQHTSAAPRARRTLVPSFVTRAGYTRDLHSRTKVGDEQPRRRLGIYRIKDGHLTWVAPQRRFSILSPPRWNRAGDRVAFLALSEDFKDRWIFLLDTSTGETSVLDHLHDDAWIGGPRFSTFTFGWTGGGQSLYFISEKDGWAHLYLVNADGSHLRQLTRGKWEVSSVELSRSGKYFYLTTSEADLGERHFYRMPVEGGERVRLTGMPGRNRAYLSPDEKQLAIVRSFANQPPELYLQRNRPGARPRQLTVSTTDSFRQHRWIVPQIVSIPARDGSRLRARFYKPDHPAPGHPAIIFVHGAGYLQNVHRWWSSYYREYMFHHFLMQHGYQVLDIDYRGSAGYGRDWRTAIYRHMGGTDLTDQVDGARWLVNQQEADPRRLGIYGGSYGGFLTLMAMFTQPDVFAAGAALRPVTDWAHYNHFYTSRILNRPQEDKEAYSRSSPIYFAQGLRGALLICHGMVDTNVHFQDTVRLVQRLIELGKENWEVAIYPVESHGFRNATSWADEYKRIFRLFEENLKR